MKEEAKPKKVIKTYQPISEEQISMIIADQTIHCEEQNCPTNVARILSFTDVGATSCTGFLVADDILMTNAHCVNGDIETFCKRTAIFFPTAFNHGSRYMKCKEVLKRGIIDGSATPIRHDYAFLKLVKGPGLPVIKLNSKEGVEDNELLTVWSMDPEDILTGKLVKRTCRARQKYERLAIFTGPRAPYMIFDQCEVLHGNSGSPMLDENGEAKGIIFALTELTKPAEVLSVGYNFTCAYFPELELDPNGKCDVSVLDLNLKLMHGLQ